MPTGTRSPFVENQSPIEVLGRSELPRKGVTRGRREQITHTLPPEMLAKIDLQASQRGITRAGFINFAISRALDELQV